MLIARRVCILLLVLGLFGYLATPVDAKAKQYQVTGTVLSVTDEMIVVQKSDEKWEIDRTPDTKIDGDLKVGAKVTIHYHMTADRVESKGSEKGK